MLDDYSYANPTMSSWVLERFPRAAEMPQVRLYIKTDPKSSELDEFGYAKAAAGKDINVMVVEKSVMIKCGKQVATRTPLSEELEGLDSKIMKYRKYDIVDSFSATSSTASV